MRTFVSKRNITVDRRNRENRSVTCTATGNSPIQVEWININGEAIRNSSSIFQIIRQLNHTSVEAELVLTNVSRFYFLFCKPKRCLTCQVVSPGKKQEKEC